MRYAADVLGDIGDRKAVGSLIETLKHPSIDVLYYVIQAIGKLKDDAATPALLPFLDQDMWLQSVAVEASELSETSAHHQSLSPS